MHVREFIKPAPIKLKGRMQSMKDGKPEIVESWVDYTYDDYAGEHLWAYPKWNTEESWQDAQIRIGEAMEVAVGQPIKFQDLDDWEKFREANNAADIKGPNAWRVRKHQKAGKGARAPIAEVEAAQPAANGAS